MPPADQQFRLTAKKGTCAHEGTQHARVRPHHPGRAGLRCGDPLMGYELYREVKKWAPESLTHREKLTAMVLADDANEETRLTWSSVVDPEIMRQAMVKNERDMRKVLARLQEAGVIEHVGGGHNGRVAKYRFLRMAPAVAGSDRTGYEPTPVDGLVQKEPPTDGVGGSIRHRRRSNSNPPTPLSSSTTPPPSPPPAAPAPVMPPPVTEDREGGREEAALTPQEQAAADALTRITAATPQLALGQREIVGLAPLAVPWLERTTEARLAQALTAGLPAAIGSPAGIIRRRLLDKLPAALVPAQASGPGLPEWCGQCGDGNPAARYNARFRTTDMGLCHCHPQAA